MTGRMLDRVDKIQTGQPDARQRPQPEEGPLALLYEDNALIVVDKPAGTVVHPTYKNTSGTLLNAVLWRYRHRADVQPGILTRLDKGTSGVVVIALTPALHASLQREMTAGHVTKEYLAVVHSVPEPAHGRIVLPLGRSSEDRRLVVVREDGARCETEYEVVAQQSNDGETTSLVRCRLLTGRTHQIRVHLAASGWPIVGDRVYNSPRSRQPPTADRPTPENCALDRQALHAWRVTFPHPLTRASLTVTSALPADMARLVRASFERGTDPMRLAPLLGNAS